MSPTTGVHTRFSEVMRGQCWGGELLGRTPCNLELDVDIPEMLHPLADVRASMYGHVDIPSLADDPDAAGTLHIAPLTRRRIRYTLDFTGLDGRKLRLDGWKSVSYLRLLSSMTTLPATVTDEAGTIVAEALVRFDVRRGLVPMLRSFRIGRPTVRPDFSGHRDRNTDLLPRWDGSSGRLEVWYTTLTDPESGTGFWVHHELVAPSDGGTAHTHGWATVFPSGQQPEFARFGPTSWQQPRAGYALDGPNASVTSTSMAGKADGIEWDLAAESESSTLFTFPRWAWRTKLLPGAQVVPQPSARYHGTIRYGDRTLRVANAPGATSHIYGHGNAQRWAWLHAELGDGDVAEVVAAVSTRPVLRSLPPLPFVRLRIDGQDWPFGDTLLTALRLRAEIDLPTWRVWGKIGDYAIRIEVTQPEESTVAVDYRDPDGSPAVCRNSERADAHILVEQRSEGGWKRLRQWHLVETAHAEVGDRD